jgi:hypothetical protein
MQFFPGSGVRKVSNLFEELSIPKRNFEGGKNQALNVQNLLPRKICYVEHSVQCGLTNHHPKCTLDN